MPTYDFDFQRYIARRKGARDAEAREGSVYAYSGEQGIRRTLVRLRPVGLALEGTVRLWRATARAEVLGPSVRASERHHPKVLLAGARAAEVLHVTLPPISVSPSLPMAAHTFGTDDEPHLLVHAGLGETLSGPELGFVLGAELGRVQNRHVLLLTALHFLDRSRGAFSKLVVKPAQLALTAWSRRAQITADRAGLIACRDLAVARSAMDKVAALEHDLAARGSDGSSRQHSPQKRIAALEIFAASSYYRALVGEPGGTSPTDTDQRVSAFLKSDEEEASTDAPSAPGPKGDPQGEKR